MIYFSAYTAVSSRLWLEKISSSEAGSMLATSATYRGSFMYSSFYFSTAFTFRSESYSWSHMLLFTRSSLSPSRTTVTNIFALCLVSSEIF